MLASQHKLTEWVAKQKLRRSQIVPLAAAWFGNSLIDYVIYRLSYFALNVVLLMSLHIIEFYLLTKIFDQPSLLHSVLLMRLTSFAIGAAWWGALEVMRKRIRVLRAKHNQEELAQELGRWYLLGLACLTIFTLFAIYFSYLGLITEGDDSLSNWYYSAIFLTLGISFWKETKKAGVYAVSRVWRPLWSVTTIPVLGLVLMVIFWWWLGEYTIVATLVLTRLISAAVALYFIARTQKHLQYPTVSLPSLKEFAVFLKGIICLELFAAALAFLVIDIGGIMVGLMSVAHHESMFIGSAFILFYFINPLLKAGSDWAMLIYFDFKKYQEGVLETFLPAFTKKFLLITPIIGLFFGSLAIMATAGYFHQDVYLISLVFLVLFVLRSGIAFLQIIAFCQERYGRVIFSGIGMLVAVIGMNFVNSPGAAILILLFGLGISFATAIAPGLFNRTLKSTRFQVNAHAWFSRLKKEKQPVQFWHFQLVDGTSFYQRKIFLQLLLPKKIYQSSAWFWLDPNNVLGFTTQQDLRDFFTKMAVRQAGLVKACHISPLADNGEIALRQAAELLTPGLTIANSTVNPIDPKLGAAQLHQLFQEQFPEGWCHYDRKTLSSAELKYSKLKKGYFTILMYKISRALRSPCDCEEDRELSISIAFPKNSKPFIFVIPFSVENRLLAEQWKKNIYRWNVSQVLSR